MHAGADLMDMNSCSSIRPEWWPPGVQGILVTEGVRGEGGILKNKEGRRFMFDDIPELCGRKPLTHPRRAGDTRRATSRRAVRPSS